MISDVRLQHFRSYKDESFEFDPGVNIIVGPNASGKTNLLEALLVCCVSGSYRVRDHELIAHKRRWARLDAHTEHNQRTIKLEANDASNRLKKTTIIDNKPYLRLPMAQTLPVVLFEPNHLQLLHGSPELRREFIDNLLEQTVVGFGLLRRQYRRALAQRNALLKTDGSMAQPQMFVWNIRLSELGGQIADHRRDLLKSFSKRLTPLYQELSKTNGKIKVTYNSTCGEGNYSSGMLRKLDTGTVLDFQRGFTAHGPHRDDLVFELNNHPASEVASRGEIRTLILALKIIEMHLLETARDQKPLLLLDDVFSELDTSRRKALTDHLNKYQTFITTTDADVVVHHFMEQCRIIPLGG